MKFQRIVVMLMLSLAALAISLACSVNASIPFVSQAAPSATKRATRVARATFTPRPAATETDVPEPTEEPTDVPEPTAEPTEVPPTPKPATAKPTAKPKPTDPPRPTDPPQPTKSQYKYSFIKSDCAHSGGTHIFVTVYADYKNPNSQLSGIRVVASYAPDSPAFGDQVGVTKVDGSFDYVMAEPGVWTGTAYAWVVDKDNNRISEIGGPVQLNDKGPDDPTTCHHAKFYFAGGK